METEQMDHNTLVAKDNVLIPQIAKFELSELRFLAYCLAHYNSKKNRNRQITAKVIDLCKFFPMHESSAYRVIRQVILSLARKPAEFQIGKTVYLYQWFSGLQYQTDTGEFTFCISPEMEPFLLGLATNFTQWRLGDVYQFKSASTWKLYENLAQWRTKRRWTIKLDELRLRLGVAGKYPRWAALNRDVIGPAVDEINELSDLRIEYHPEKRGRQIVGLVFLIDQKIDDDKLIVLEPPEDTIYKALLSYGIHEKTASNYARNINRQSKVNQILAKLPAIVERAQKSGHPIPKYIIGAIKNELNQLSLLEEQPKEQILPQHQQLSCPEVIIFPGMELREKLTNQVWIIEDGNKISSFAGFALSERNIKQYIIDGIFVIVA